MVLWLEFFMNSGRSDVRGELERYLFRMLPIWRTLAVYYESFSSSFCSLFRDSCGEKCAALSAFYPPFCSAHSPEGRELVPGFTICLAE